MAKFKVGDKVRILNGWAIPNYTGGWEMDEYIGDICTIETIETYPDLRIGYRVKENIYIYDERGLESAYANGGIIPKSSKPIVVDSDFSIRFENGSSIMSIKKEEKPMRFTFSTKEGYRIDKSNNTKIPTITTTVTATIGNVGALATCDKIDYDERQGVLEALANLACYGDFDKEYRKAVKANKRADEVKRTCIYCGKTFDTIEEKEAEEAWHIERKKARRERYLLRRRAKEIAFEEKAQQLAKEIKNESATIK